MIAKLKDVETPGASGLTADPLSAERAMIADEANISASPASADGSDRRLRNALILANIIGWILILGLLKLIFF
ncbi:MAG: hypothetical protein ACTHNN_04425 [Xanthobacteraceae bacterium]